MTRIAVVHSGFDDRGNAGTETTDSLNIRLPLLSRPESAVVGETSGHGSKRGIRVQVAKGR